MVKEGAELVAVTRQVWPSPRSGKGDQSLKRAESAVVELSGTRRVTIDCQRGQGIAVALDVSQRLRLLERRQIRSV